MHETLAQEWQRRMAARSGLVALLFAIPVLVALLIGFSGGLGTFSLGVSSLATGPDEEILRSAARPASALDLSAPVPAPAPGATVTAAGADGGGASGAPTASSPGLTPVGAAPVAPSSGGGGGGEAGGAGTSPPPVSEPPPAPPPAPPVSIPADPTGGTLSDAVNGAATQVQGTVDDVAGQVP